jgi:hypothetical protein
LQQQTYGSSSPTTNQALVPPTGSHPPLKRQGSPLLQHKDDALVFHPRTTRARATDTPRVARPVALTPWQDTRLLWQAGGRRFASVMMTASKKVCHTIFQNISFFLSSLFSLSPQGSRKGTFRRSPSQRRKRAPSPPTDQGFEGCAPRGSATAPEHSGSEPFTDQGFEGWPLEGIRQPPQNMQSQG